MRPMSVVMSTRKPVFSAQMPSLRNVWHSFDSGPIRRACHEFTNVQSITVWLFPARPSRAVRTVQGYATGSGSF